MNSSFFVRNITKQTSQNEQQWLWMGNTEVENIKSHLKNGWNVVVSQNRLRSLIKASLIYILNFFTFNVKFLKEITLKKWGTFTSASERPNKRVCKTKLLQKPNPTPIQFATWHFTWTYLSHRGPRKRNAQKVHSKQIYNTIFV